MNISDYLIKILSLSNKLNIIDIFFITFILKFIVK